MYYNFMMYFYLYLQQHVSASNPAIRKVMFFIQEYNWNVHVTVYHDKFVYYKTNYML